MGDALLSAEDQYTAVHWGDAPRRHSTVECPALRKKQALVMLGKLRAVFWTDPETGEEGVITPRRPYPFLTFGQKDNRIYVCGGSTAEMARKKLWGPVGSRRWITRTDYDAKKGGEDVYWYHDHEPPYPELEVLRGGFPAYRGGQYWIEEAGIVG